MRNALCTLAVLAVCSAVQADEPFQWSITEHGGFAWAITENGVAASDGRESQHRLSFGTEPRGVVAGTHIGRGFYVSCGHLVFGRTGSFCIDDDPVAAEWIADPRDFLLVRIPSHDSGPKSVWDNTPPVTGQRLTIRARLTGDVTGIVDDVVTTDGARKINIDPECPVTQSGDSGSGVFDERGRIVGVHVALINGERATRFIPLSLVQHILTQPFSGQVAAVAASDETKIPDDGWLLFGATWCTPCRDAHGAVPGLKAKGITIKEIDIEQQREIADRFHIERIPTWVEMRGGVEVSRSVGAPWPGENE